MENMFYNKTQDSDILKLSSLQWPTATVCSASLKLFQAAHLGPPSTEHWNQETRDGRPDSESNSPQETVSPMESLCEGGLAVAFCF